ncbi:hypothetical protein P3T76_007953 [Phytophthora citrophthora]|uniref:Chromo domain-containing protein n=1 Tax=Phytophthora citrophthora TaxID=4793 RepID=A0AAD9GL49_9STRA|nr:hypothetical protein P3T76_007953 [Phytophthora citrophthora]
MIWWGKLLWISDTIQHCFRIMARTRAKRTLDAAFPCTGSIVTDDPTSRSRGRMERRKSPLNEVGHQDQKEDNSATDEEQAVEREYEVESILEEKDGFFFFVKWAGYESGDNTWEPERNLKPATVAEFRRRHSQLSINAQWMPRADYRAVGSAYLTGVLARMEKRKDNRKSANCDSGSYETRWTNTQFQTKPHVHLIPPAKIVEGNANYYTPKSLLLARSFDDRPQARSCCAN